MSSRLPLAELLGRVDSGWRERHLLLLLDYDGTLVPIRDRAEKARPSPELLETLTRLGQQGDVDVAILSGRALPELRRLLPLDGIFRSGCHGAEIEGPGGWREEILDRSRFRKDTDAFRRRAEARLGEVEGEAARECVRRHFLITRHLRDYLSR